MIKVHNKSLGKLLKNEYVYYAVLALSVISVVKYLLSRNVYCLLSFVGIVILTSKFLTKNKTLPFVFALFASSFLLGCGKIIEGMEEKKEEDKEDSDSTKLPSKNSEETEMSEEHSEEGSTVFETGNKDQIDRALVEQGGFTKQANTNRGSDETRGDYKFRKGEAEALQKKPGGSKSKKKSKLFPFSSQIALSSHDDFFTSNQNSGYDSPAFFTTNQNRGGAPNTIGTIGNAAFANVGNFVQGTVGVVENAGGAVVGTAGNAFGTAGGAVVNVIENVVGKVADAVSKVIN